MQSLRRIPAGAQVRVLFPNRSYAASTSNTDALTLRLNAISRLNSGNFLRFDDRNLVRTDFLCFQRRGLQSGVQFLKGRKPEISSSNSYSRLPNFDKFCDQQWKGVNKKKFSSSEMREIEDYLLRAYFYGFLPQNWFMKLWFFFFVIVSCIGWKLESDLKDIVGMRYATYLSSESVPFDDCIEKLLKSGKVTQIIHLPHFGKAVAVLSPGAIVDGLTAGDKDAVVLNLKNSSFFVIGTGFVLKIRRMEKQIGIAKSVPVKVVEEHSLWFLLHAAKLLLLISLPILISYLSGRIYVWKAKSLIQRKRTVRH